MICFCKRYTMSIKQNIGNSDTNDTQKLMILKDCLGICWFPEVSVLDRKEIYAPSAGKPFA